MTRQHVTFRLRQELLSELDSFVEERRTRDDRACRTEIVENALKIFLRRNRKRPVSPTTTVA